MRRISFAVVLSSLALLAGCGDDNLGNGPIGPLPCPTGDTCVSADAAAPTDASDSQADASADSGIDPVAHQACINRACGANNCGDPGVLCDGEAVNCGVCTGNFLCGGNSATEGTSVAGKCNDDCLSTFAITHGGCGTTTYPIAAWGVVASCMYAPYIIEADGGIEIRPLGVGGTKYTTTSAGINYNCWAN